MHDKLEAHDEHGAGSDCPVALHNCEPAPETQCVLTGIFKRHRVVEEYREAACTGALPCWGVSIGKRRVPAVRLFHSHRDKPRPSRTGIHWGGAGVDNWRGINHSQNKTELHVLQNQGIKYKMAISQDLQVLIWISKHGVKSPQTSSLVLSALPVLY